tara:strand:+ start:8 stop:172 length:165 start_codon:yes stop_codon:yes gene_type:complete
MIEEKIGQLKEDYEKVSVEIEKFMQIRLKVLGAIEVLESMKEEPKEVKKEENKK